MDNKTINDGRDKAKIDIDDHSEVEYLHQQWKQFNHAQIKEAIEKYGPEREKIEDFLNKRSGAM